MWFDNAHSYYTAEMGGSFEVSGYPGYWYLNVRSPIWHCASSTSACYFTSANPAGTLTGGWA